jgi:Leucine-rich repeat (LRR) protein
LVKQIIQLNHLTKFNLSKNYISEIPPEIGKFQALRHLDISYNTLSKLPVEFQHLKGLEVPDFDPQVLIIDGNQLSNNPSHGLDGLKELSMSSNQVKDLLSLPG